MSDIYPRDMVGYGRNPPHPEWPGGARIAVQFVINYEEGAENNILHGDAASESLLTEFGFAMPRQGERYLPVESQYEYGSRVGFWRLHRMFTANAVPVRGTTMCGCAGGSMWRGIGRPNFRPPNIARQVTGPSSPEGNEGAGRWGELSARKCA